MRCSQLQLGPVHGATDAWKPQPKQDPARQSEINFHVEGRKTSCILLSFLRPLSVIVPSKGFDLQTMWSQSAKHGSRVKKTTETSSFLSRIVKLQMGWWQPFFFFFLHDRADCRPVFTHSLSACHINLDLGSPVPGTSLYTLVHKHVWMGRGVPHHQQSRMTAQNHCSTHHKGVETACSIMHVSLLKTKLCIHSHK